MQTTQKIKQIQHRAIQNYANTTDSYRFFNILTSPELFSIVEEQLPEHRERSFPPTETLSLFLAQVMNADRSCQNIVNETAIQRLVNGLALCSTNTSSYCRARQRLPLERVSELVRHSGQLVDQHVPEEWRWQGRPVRLVDGTTVILPDTAQNQAVYPQLSEQTPGVGFPISRLVGVICLASGSILNAAIGPYQGKGTNEQSLLRELLDTFNKGDIVLGDAYYAGYFLLAALIERGVDGVFEQLGARQRSTDFRKGKKLGQTDHLIIYDKPKKKPDWMTQAHYDNAPDTLTVRELKVGHKILVTTMLSPKQAPKHALKALYKSRWQIELNLRNIKTTLGMDTFSCKTPGMVEKEMWVYFLAYNLIRLVMAESASLFDRLPRQLSFKHTLQLWRAWRQHAVNIDDSDSLDVLLRLIAQSKIGHRPGRIEPRVVKRRPKPFPAMRQPRECLRENVKQYGHPKKQK